MIRSPRRRAPLLCLPLALLAGCSTLQQPFQVASGFTSHTVCSDTFITGRDPQQALAERILAFPAFRLVRDQIAIEADMERKTITTTVAGLNRTRAAWRGNEGCQLLDHAEAPVPPYATGHPVTTTASLPPIAGPGLVITNNPRLAAALDAAFKEPPEAQNPVRTKAVLVLQDGRLIAERYAPGYGIETPQLSFSMHKTVTASLIGLLVRDGRLRPDQPVKIAASGATATVEQLLRQTSGSGIRQNNSGFDSNSRMLYVSHDPYAAALVPEPTAPAGERWAYTDANFVILSRLIRDTLGGRAEDVNAYAWRELFGPLGIEQATFEFDRTGTFFGANHMFASARDYARFGQLLLNQGLAGERRVLPAAWIERITTPTLDTGYGAGLWTNRKPGLIGEWGVPWGFASAPPDTYFARGFMGQFIVVIPSRRLVIVRLGVSHHKGDGIEFVNAMVGDILAALPQN